ncbi:SulP family inorganic anion transporter [Marinomonas atlantica]|uniref:SulP family inorganic anion transporter n=1 Tax=Marinomonas atlantica TaxID=1806668 RepID=UPI000830F061|nr:SulP family inorganic anion transporter [Marinomonas atlantica]
MPNTLRRWLPWLTLVNGSTVKADFIAGLTCASMSIPQGIAFAAIAGLPAEYGFYSAIVAPIIAVLFGSSWHMVCGPATAISALLFSSLSGLYVPGSAEFIQAALAITFLAGLIQLALGLAKLGNLTNFVSHAVMVGFITGAAFLIMLSQVQHALTADLPRPENLSSFLNALLRIGPETNMYSVSICLVTVLAAIIIRKISTKLPHYLLALIAGSVFGYFVNAGVNNVPLVGELNEAIPPFALIDLSSNTLRELLPGAVVLALIGLLEAASIAKAIALKTHQEIDTNREFIGQGMSNTVGSLFSNYMSSGSFTRSGINVEAGAQTPLAIIFSSVFLLLILSLIAPLFSHLPIPAMAGIIILVGWRLIEFKELLHYAKTSRAELSIAMVTLLSTIGISLEFGILVGVGLSLALFLNQTAKPNVRILAPMDTHEGRYFHNIMHFNLETCPQIHFIRLDGPLYFGSVDYMSKQFQLIEHDYPHKDHWVILCRGLSAIDMQGAHFLKQLVDRRREENTQIHLVVRYLWQLDLLKRFGVLEKVGADHTYPAKGVAVEKIEHDMNLKQCASCSKNVFRECQQRKLKGETLIAKTPIK